MTRRVRSVGLAALMAASLLPLATGAHAQTAAGGALLQSYTFDDPATVGLAEMQLTVLPFAVAVPFGDRISILASGAWARGMATGDEGAEIELAGPTDTEVGIAIALGPDRMVLTAGASLPTGQSTHSTTEAVVASIVAAELLPFGISSWGSGGGAGGDIALAFASGAWGIGLSGGYRAAREFEPLSDETFAYRPGDQIGVRLALDRDLSSGGTFSVLLGAQRFTEDQLSGANLFRSGNRLEGVLTYAFPVGLAGSALIYGGAYHRANGTLLLDDPDLIGAADSPAQQLFSGGVDLRLPLGRTAAFLPGVDGRVFRSEDGVGQGWVGTVGGSLEVILSGRRGRESIVLSPSARYRMGHVIVEQDSETDLTGWEAGLVLSVGAGR